jgi:hypothetical protein
MNQTTQMHQIARELPEYEHRFTPYYVDPGPIDVARRLGLLEFTIGGFKVRNRCLNYLAEQRLPVDLHGASGGYDLVVTCSDLYVPANVHRRPLVLVQEGILDPQNFAYRLCRALPLLPRYLASTSTTGLSFEYRTFCVASEGYRQHFSSMGCDPSRIAVTGIPNFDDCRRYLDNDFPHRGFALACTSDTRETFKLDSRRAFIQRFRAIAAGRPLIVKLHPNEDAPRAVREIGRWVPEALVYAKGSAEEMIANCEVLVCQYSSTAFVGLALGKEVHSHFPLEELRRLAPIQNGGLAARNIAAECRKVLGQQDAP